MPKDLLSVMQTAVQKPTYIRNRICDVEGCGKKHVARGLCRRHYDQMPERQESRRRAKRKYDARNRAIIAAYLNARESA